MPSLSLHPFVCGLALGALSCAPPPENSSPAAPDGSSPPASSRGWLVEVGAELGIDFRHQTGARGGWNMAEIMTAGVGLLDYDGDGDLDIYATNGNFALAGPAADPRPTNSLWRQEADGRFVDETRSSGLDDTGYGMGLAIGDVDNDGDLDIYVTNCGPNRFYRNRGDGTFEDATSASGLTADGWSSSATFLDYDRDGWLDLYVARYVELDPQKICPDSAGRPNWCGPAAFPPEHDLLFHNEGDGRFREVGQKAGIAAVRAAGLGVVAEDFSGDGWPDIYVANDGYANYLWVNRGDGTFVDDAVLLGAAYDMHGRAEAGMGVIARDLDNDLLPDLFLTHLANETNTFYRNRGPGLGFEDASGESGVGAASLVRTGFGIAAFDLELDGDLDLVVVNGRVTRAEPREDSWVEAPWDLVAEPNLLYVAEQPGRFRTNDELAPELTRAVEVSRGLAVGDLDDDGDLDFVVANAQTGLRVYRNDAPRQGHWLKVRAIDPRLRRDAIGARLVLRGGQRGWAQTIGCGSSYLSAHDSRAHFGLGPVDQLDDLEVQWPDGLRERFAVVGVDRELRVERGAGEVLP